jgi:hypothetical protein
MVPNYNGVLPDAAQIFALAGCLLSFVASGLMLYLILSNPDARKEVRWQMRPPVCNIAAMEQVRPRMLIVLAALDLLAALFLGLASWRPIEYARDQLLNNIFWSGLGDFFMFSSWTWTCAIAYHGNFFNATEA